MTKKQLIIPFLLIPLLAGCGGAKPGEKGSNVLTAKMIDVNLKANLVTTRAYYNNAEVVSTIDIPSGYTEITSMLPKYFVLAQNGSTGLVSVWSKLNGRLIASVNTMGMASHGYATAFVDNDNILPPVFSIYEWDSSNKGYYALYDAFGNTLYYTSNYKDVEIHKPAISRREMATTGLFEGQRTYLLITSWDSETNETKNTNLGYTDDMNIETISDDLLPYSIGSVSTYEPVDLSICGLDGYIATESMSKDMSTIYLIVTKDSKNVSKIDIPVEHLESLALIGQNFYYQSRYEVNEKCEDYDIYNPSTLKKYNIETHKVGIITQVDEIIELPFYYTFGNMVLDENGLSNYCVTKVQEISNHVLVGEAKQYIVDTNFVLHDDVTNAPLYRYRKIGDNYYNSTSGYIYDKDLKPILNIAASKLALTSVIGDYIVVKNDVTARYGLVDSNGNILVDCVFTNYIATLSNDKVIVFQDGTNYFEYGIADKSLTSVSYSSIIFYGLNVRDTDTTKDIYFYDEKLKSYSLSDSYTLSTFCTLVDRQDNETIYLTFAAIISGVKSYEIIVVK